MPRSTQEDRLDRLLLSRRLASFAGGSALAALPSFLSIVVLLSFYGPFLAPAFVAVWAAPFLLFLAARLWLASRIDPDETGIPALRRQYRAIQLVLACGATAWAVSLPLAAWVGQGRAFGVFAPIGAVVFCSVMIMHRSMPAVARFHIAVVGLGLGAAEVIQAGLAVWPLLVLLLLFTVALLGAVETQERQFVAAIREELRREQSERTVSMLLNDHESQAADWLWTIDADRSMAFMPERLAASLGQGARQLEGKDFLSLFEPGRDRDRIAEHVAERTAFRELPVVVDNAGARRNLRLSGHPRRDGGFAGVGRDVTEQHDVEDRVRAMAYIDPLTGLANRHLFNQRLRELLGEDGGAPRPVVVFTLDLDDFKAINDTHGQIFGDSLLREVGARFRREARSSDLVARLGGDEFAVLVEAPGGDGMLIERAHRLLAAAREPVSLEDQTVQLSTTVGVARAMPGCDATEVMRRADLALYAAKAKGRDRMALFDEALDRQARERRALELELRDGIARGELRVHYQPLIALESGEVTGYEALVRWSHPARGLLLPDQFLPIAEDSGLIVPLGDWVVARTLAEVSEWEGDFRIALNLSPSQVRNPRFVATVERALAATGFPAHRLEFEITEHVLFADAEAGSAMLHRLRGLGAEIALDDFGTGYSSLSYLRRFRFDRVKIDRSFVRDLETSDEARAIVSATTRLAEALGMKTTAEGVESAGQLDMLRKLGCDEAQGFLILEPVEARRIEAARRKGEDFPGAGAKVGDYREARQASRGRFLPG